MLLYRVLSMATISQVPPSCCVVQFPASANPHADAEAPVGRQVGGGARRRHHAGLIDFFQAGSRETRVGRYLPFEREVGLLGHLHPNYRA